jgi:predicted AAA+ superfamily ATPase
MLAHRQGAPLNAAELARNIGVDVKTVARYLDLLVDLLLVRRLPPWHGNIGKRLVKAPRIYLKDSGILHALLTIPDMDSLLSHPVLGASWEGFVLENILSNSPEGVSGYFYRTGGGAEIDLLLVFPNGRRWAIEIKRTMKPRPERGFHEACADVSPERRFIVYPGNERFPLAADTDAAPLREIISEISVEK